MTAPAPLAVLTLDDPDASKLPPPDRGPYFVVTKDGPFLHKQTFFGRALVPVTKIDSLPEINAPKGLLTYDIPKLPAGLLGQAWSFFAAVYEDLHTEAMVYITHHAEHGYRLFVPHQKNTHSHVTSDFKLEHIANGYAIVGTIHSHCNFGAFHSGTDDSDASRHDGLHITIGHVDRTDKPEYAVMIAVNGTRWDFKLDDITDQEPAKVAHPAWWHRYVSREGQSSNNRQPQPNWHNTAGPKPNGSGSLTVYRGHAGSQTTSPPPKPTGQQPTIWATQGHDDLIEAANAAVDIIEPTDRDAWEIYQQLMSMDNDLGMIADELADLGIDMRIRFFVNPDLATETTTGVR